MKGLKILLILPCLSDALSPSLHRRAPFAVSTKSIRSISPVALSSSLSSQGDASASPVTLHGRHSSYLPIHQLNPESNPPVVVPLLGVAPVPYSAVKSAPIVEPAHYSSVHYSFVNADPTSGGSGGMAVLEGLSTLHGDPDAHFVGFVDVASTCGVPVPNPDTELLFVIDLNNKELIERNFYFVRSKADDSCVVRQTDDVSLDSHEVLGKVIVVVVEWDEGLQGSKSGFSEESDYF